MSTFLQPAYIETIINDVTQRDYSTPILDMFFKRKKSAPDGFVRVPKEVSDYQDILPLIERGSAITPSSIGGTKQWTTYELRTFGDLKVLKPYEIEKLKNQLAGLTGVTYAQKKVELVNDIIGEFNRKVDLTREYMAGSALTGTIKDKDGNTIETFDIPADNKLGTQNVSGGGVKIWELIRAMIKQMHKSTKYRGNVGFIIGENAYDKILASDEYQKWTANPANALTAEEIVRGVEGYMLNRKYPFLVADAKYYNNGTTGSFFNEDSLIIAPIGLFTEFYAPIATNKGVFSKIKHIDTFEMYNPDGTAYRLQSSAMPIVTLPNAIVSAVIS